MKEIVAAVGDDYDAVSVRGKNSVAEKNSNLLNCRMQKVARHIGGPYVKKENNQVLL